jgi:hypothetical protein
MNFFKKLFKKEIPVLKDIKNKILPDKNLNDIAQFDDVWVGLGGSVYEGWVVERKGDLVSVVYTDAAGKLQDIFFTIVRPLNRDILKEDNKILYLTKEAAGLK